ncbi:uncharacterized protein LOC118512685 [Anopheles stephensi]|uniref:uncharacterized protein LOC118512685 n=1 Tax=Anopheles stephensi TaxID=30069 RepID=UPI001658BA59|nr:uncharacterized protein LOC118512685 [Anopheles stephensi]
MARHSNADPLPFRGHSYKMCPISKQTLWGVFFMLQAFGHCSAQSTLHEMVDEIATFDNASDTSGTNVCIFSTANSSLAMFAPLLLPTLISKYPTTFVDMKHYVDVESASLASLVLLDLTAYHYEFPFNFIQKRLNHHPCYRKSAKFIILMGGTSFQRKATAIRYLDKYSIMNYILVPLANESTPVTVYTKHRFTGQEYYFRSSDRPVQQFFPDKLRNLNGYTFVMQGGTIYPYLLFLEREGQATGMVPNLVKHIIRDRCNGTTYFTEEEKYRRAVHALFNVPLTRFHYQQTIYFREDTGIYIVCPVRSVRDFLRHLLKPFSVGIWIILVGLFIFCRVVKILFPSICQYDLISITFFGGGGVEYLQPFAFRIITLTLAVLMFFLSEAYNTKIISLMSLSKFYEQPQTIEELIDSDYRILSPRSGSKFLGPISANFLSYRATLREEERLGDEVHRHYCSIMHLGNAWLAVSMHIHHIVGLRYIVREPLFRDKNLIQLEQHTAFYDLFEDAFGLINDSGLWSYRLQRAEKITATKPLDMIYTQFQEVIFYFNDLYCVWILIVVGWFISTVCFVGEIVTERWRQRKLKRVARKFQAVQKYRLVLGWFNVR